MRGCDFDLYRPLYVTVVYQGKCSHCMRIGVAVPLSGTVARLREAVSVETKIPPDQVPPLTLMARGHGAPALRSSGRFQQLPATRVTWTHQISSFCLEDKGT